MGGEIRQVLNNLIGNAIDALSAGGRLLLRSREATHPRTGMRGLVITVADTGSGKHPAKATLIQQGTARLEQQTRHHVF